MITTATHPEVKRAPDAAAIAPLIELCKAGRLFEVQAWILEGKPVNPPPIPTKGARPRSPLDVAIDRGFHSLVQVLLEAGAVQEPENYDSPMNRVLQARRFDLVQLLVQHGYDPAKVDMNNVFQTWDPQIMEYFIERGAEIWRGEPFATALCERIRTALGLYKKYLQRFPELHEQGNVALRHHCKEGNLKWVSLLLWAGADPFKPGEDVPGAVPCDDDEALSALGFAALYGHFEVFDLKPVRARRAGAGCGGIVRYLTQGKGIEVLKRWLQEGLNPNDHENGGCSTIQHCLTDLEQWCGSGYPWGTPRRGTSDTEHARGKLRAIHLLARHGGKWAPADRSEVNNARRSLLQMTPDYTVEFLWIMSKYKACTIDSIRELLRTPTIKSHVQSYSPRIQELLASWGEATIGEVRPI